jgi:hypothetical protein
MILLYIRHFSHDTCAISLSVADAAYALMLGVVLPRLTIRSGFDEHRYYLLVTLS